MSEPFSSRKVTSSELLRDIFFHQLVRSTDLAMQIVGTDLGGRDRSRGIFPIAVTEQAQKVPVFFMMTCAR
jgi:hypothetical protein